MHCGAEHLLSWPTGVGHYREEGSGVLGRSVLLSLLFIAVSLDHVQLRVLPAEQN